MPTQDVDQSFEALLDYVRDNRGFDFTGYKRASLMRRVQKRMHEVGIARYDEYHDFLEVHPEEFTHLFNTILINVTSFFRDQSAWDSLAEQAIPAIVEQNDGRQHIRVWSVGCASGEEAYSVAMLLAEALGVGRIVDRVKIYATDVDEDALAEARAGNFSAKAVDAIPPELREKYLEPVRERQLRVQERLAARRHLRKARPREGRADLSRRPDRLPQHAHVLQLGGPVAHLRGLPLRAEAGRLPLPREVRDAPDAHEHVRADRPQAAALLTGSATQ